MDSRKAVDLHAHPVTESFRDAMDFLGINVIADDGFPLPKWSAEGHIEFIEAAGITHTVLSIPTPHIHNGEDEKSCKAARTINEELSGICHKYPKSFSFVAGLPLPCVQGAIQEAEYAMDTLGAVGVKLATNMNGIYLGDAALDPLMEVLNERETLAIIHPCRAKERPDYVITGKVAGLYEYPVDTTRAVLNMMANRVMTRFPKIRFVVPHCGSFLPYMLQRFVGVSGILANLGMMELVDAHAEFEKLWFDIAGDPEPVALDMLLMVADKSHIVFGSDYPHSPANVIIEKKQHLEKNGKYRQLLDEIYVQNAMKLLQGGGDK